MQRYGGIDVHSTNSLVALRDAHDHIVEDKRVANARNVVLAYLAPQQAHRTGLVVEAPDHWSWLAAGFLDAGSRGHVAKTAAITQSAGLPCRNEHVEARVLAQLLRWGIFPAGSLSPQAERAVRALFRKRAQLVRQQGAPRLARGSQWARQTGHSRRATGRRHLRAAASARRCATANGACALPRQRRLLRGLAAHSPCVAREVWGHMQTTPERTWRHTVPGLGHMVARTMVVATGPRARCAPVGDLASAWRGVKSQRLSNGTGTGRGNANNGKPSLGWACVEAAHVASRFAAERTRCSQRRQRKRPQLGARKPGAHKWARAGSDSLRAHVPLERSKALGVSRARRDVWERARAKPVGCAPAVLNRHEPSRPKSWGVRPAAFADPASAVRPHEVGLHCGEPKERCQGDGEEGLPPAAPSEPLRRVGRLNQPASAASWPQGHGRGPTMCWGSVRQGPGWPAPCRAGPAALILQGAWCGEEPTPQASEAGSGRRHLDRCDAEETDAPKT
jgi:transposase